MWLYEELIHYGQFRSGQFAEWTTQYGQNGAEVLAEFYAAQKLRQNQAAYGISVSENAENISRLNNFANQLTQMGIPH